MKPAIRLCDFWHVIEEEQQGADLVVTGILNPQDMSSEGMQKNAIIARFKVDQGGPKGSWQSMDYEKRQQTQPEPPKSKGMSR